MFDYFYKTLQTNEEKQTMKEMFEAYCKKEESKPKEVTMHTIVRIYPIISFYKASKDKEEAIKAVETFFFNRCTKVNKKLSRLAKIPFIYKRVPKIMAKVIHKHFGVKSGFEYDDIEISKTRCHINMKKCPYQKCCSEEGVPELCPVFCNSDDITYVNIHKYLKWKRTDTLGRGNQCCNFIMEIEKDSNN